MPQFPNNLQTNLPINVLQCLILSQIMLHKLTSNNLFISFYCFSFLFHFLSFFFSLSCYLCLLFYIQLLSVIFQDFDDFPSSKTVNQSISW